jgi:hypothetical protein
MCRALAVGKGVNVAETSVGRDGGMEVVVGGGGIVDVVESATVVVDVVSAVEDSVGRSSCPRTPGSVNNAGTAAKRARIISSKSVIWSVPDLPGLISIEVGSYRTPVKLSVRPPTNRGLLTRPAVQTCKPPSESKNLADVPPSYSQTFNRPNFWLWAQFPKAI